MLQSWSHSYSSTGNLVRLFQLQRKPLGVTLSTTRQDFLDLRSARRGKLDPNAPSPLQLSSQKRVLEPEPTLHVMILEESIDRASSSSRTLTILHQVSGKDFFESLQSGFFDKLLIPSITFFFKGMSYQSLDA